MAAGRDPVLPAGDGGELPMIYCRDLVKVYGSGAGETIALRGVSLDVAHGEYVAVMGPSGSGKSTLMHILGALDRPTSGRYLLEGKDVSELHPDEQADLRRERIGFVFQSFNLLPRATVLRNVTLPMVYASIDGDEREERAKVALRQVALEEDRWDHRSNELSGGQMQRVAIARALVNDPALILADEPTGNLDTVTGDLIMQTFRHLHEQGRTILLITHEQLVADYADRVIRMQDGVIVGDTDSSARSAARIAAMEGSAR